MTDKEQTMTENSTAESFEFGADISQLMNLIVNAFYSNKDIFLRELVSNASDALDKIRYKSLTDKDVMGEVSELKMNIQADKDKKVLVLSDTGIGMTKEDLISNIGTIAKSGTKAFMEALEKSKDVNMIGQFGVGFYSAFLVADKVRVVTTRTDVDDSKTYVWESDAQGKYTIDEISVDSELPTSRGTHIYLHLKEDSVEYLEENKLREIIKMHSQFIDFPIYLECEKSEEVTDDEEEEEEEKDDDAVKVENVEDEDETTKEEKKKKTKTVVSQEWKQLNEQSPVWTRKADDVTDDEHAQFYKAISNDYDTYVAKQHFHVEGQFEFTGLLYIPKKQPFDMFQEVRNKKNKVKLYVRRVFITDECKELMPEYLNFVNGIVDSQDLPLNVSREMLQQSRVVQIIRKNLVKKTIEMISNLEEKEFEEFYQNFGKCIKLGIHEDSKNRDKLSQLLRFASTRTVTEDTLDKPKLTSLADYVKNMKEDQPGIYYITGESVESVYDSPFLETLRKKGYETLFLCDPIDEYAVQQLKEFDGKKLLCATKDNTDLGDKVTEDTTKSFEATCKKIKDILEDKVNKVSVSNRMNNSPCCLTTGEHGWSANMERIVKAQAMANDQQHMFMRSQKTLEINPDHKICRKIKECIEAEEPQEKMVRDLVYLLYDTALITSGFTLDKPSQFANRIHRLVSLGLDLDDEDIVEKEEDLPPLEADGDDTNEMEEVD
tara:strand:- start:10935 stop:13088 length:2154 start_codon:yes stop_codon:yes gene_type:complete